MTTNPLRTLSFAMLLCAASLPTAAAERGEWHDTESDLTLSWRFFPPLATADTEAEADPERGKRPRPVAVLFPAREDDRWRQPDKADVEEYLADQMGVVVAEFKNMPPIDTPKYVEALTRFQKALTEEMEKHPEWRADPELLYFVPATHRLLRNAAYWNIREHGWPGSLHRILNTYNGHVVKKFGVEPADTPEDMRSPDGGEIDFNLRLDLIYPKEAKGGAPLLVDFGTLDPRMRSFRPATRRMVYPLTFLLDGYAWAVVDHCWNPLARRDNYGYWEQYSLQDWNGMAAATAAIRFFTAHAKEFHLNPDAIGVLGHSKGSYVAMRLGDPNHAEGGEFFRFTGHEDAPQPEQPWPGHSSAIQACFISMGLGVHRTEFLTEDFVPIMAAAGKGDRFGYWDRMPAWIEACQALDLDYTALMMEDLGHDYPRGWCEERGMDRMDVVQRFFDRNLKEEN